jgi:hypothetical protein
MGIHQAGQELRQRVTARLTTNITTVSPITTSSSLGMASSAILPGSSTLFRSGEDCRHFNFNSYTGISTRPGPKNKRLFSNPVCDSQMENGHS